MGLEYLISFKFKEIRLPLTEWIIILGTDMIPTEESTSSFKIWEKNVQELSYKRKQTKIYIEQFEKSDCLKGQSSDLKCSVNNC